MNQINATGLTKILIGRQGENLACQIVFDVSGWETEYGPGGVELIFQRNRNELPYPVAVDRDGSNILWTVTATDTELPGENGHCELRYYVGETIVKSQVWTTRVIPAVPVPTAETPPETEHGWVDQVLAAGAEAKQAADRAEKAVVNAPHIGANGNWYIGTEDSGVSATGPAGRDGADGKNGLPGDKGDPFTYEDFTPEQLEALRGPAGRDGTDGEPGKDGYTPVKGVDYFDGAPGKDGVDGYTPVKGVDYFDGVDGKDGYTPQKGVDYFDGEPGAKGDPFTYADFTEEQLSSLKGEKGDPGPGDMESNVYDPQGKAQDVFAYVDAQISVAIEYIMSELGGSGGGNTNPDSPAVEIVPWATGTDEQIAAMVAALDAGTLSVEETGWQVGDERTVNLSAMAATGVGESHTEQDVVLVLGNAGGKYFEDGTECHFVVLQKDSLNEAGYMNSSNTNSGGWEGCARRAWCNDVYSAAIPAALLPIFKRFKNVSGVGGGASSGTQETVDLFALAGEGEIFGSRTYAFADEVSAETQFEWYKTSANRVKKRNGSASDWWERSASSGNSRYFCCVASNGGAGYISGSLGLAPFGCI